MTFCLRPLFWNISSVLFASQIAFLLVVSGMQMNKIFFTNLFSKLAFHLCTRCYWPAVLISLICEHSIWECICSLLHLPFLHSIVDFFAEWLLRDDTLKFFFIKQANVKCCTVMFIYEKHLMIYCKYCKHALDATKCLFCSYKPFFFSCLCCTLLIIFL